VVRVPFYRSRGSEFDSWHYQIFWEALVLERGPLSLVSTIKELLGRKSSGSGLENRDYGRRDPLCWPRNTFYWQKLALTSPTSGGRSVGIIRSRTKGQEVCSIMKKIRLSSCLTNHYAMKAYWEVDVRIHVPLASTLVGAEWSDSRSGRFTLGEKRVKNRRLGGPKIRYGQYGKWIFLNLLRLELLSLFRAAGSQSLYQLW
jgi:hypothetical protein